MTIRFLLLNLYFSKPIYATFITKSCSRLSLYFSVLHGKVKDFFDFVEKLDKTFKFDCYTASLLGALILTIINY